MRSRDIATITGVVVGVTGVVALGFLLKRFLTSEKVEKFEKKLVEKVIEKSPFTSGKKKKATRKTRSKSKLVIAKLGNAKKLLSAMQKGIEYTQVMLEDVSKISYRSVRRYIDILVKQGKVTAKGYGKGKKFVKK